jgi:hypothetical protein
MKCVIRWRILGDRKWKSRRLPLETSFGFFTVKSREKLLYTVSDELQKTVFFCVWSILLWVTCSFLINILDPSLLWLFEGASWCLFQIWIQDSFSQVKSRGSGILCSPKRTATKSEVGPTISFSWLYQVILSFTFWKSILKNSCHQCSLLCL